MLPEEAAQLDFFTYHPSSVILGQDSKGRLACFNRQGHILVMAPPRSGKGVGFVQANLIGYQGSMVVTDPKGENAAVSERFRRTGLGHNVVILDPTGKLNSYGIEPPIRTHRFNPLAVFANANYAEAVDDIERIADALLVPKDGEREQHWRDGARSFLRAILTYLVFFMPPEDQNLIMLARLANGLETPLDDIFLALTHNPHPDRVMQDVIAKSGAWWDKVNTKERASFISVALRSLTWLNSPVWYEHLTGSDFHPYDLKAGKTTVYIVCPFDKLEDYSPWFRLVLSSCIVAVLRAPNRSQIPTLFMLDEYAATIGRLATLEHSIPYIEGVGGRFAMVFQFLKQMNDLWPDPGYHGIFGSAGAHVFFNVGDQFTAKYVSDYIGKYSAMTPSQGGITFVQRDLLTPDEVRVHPESDMIAFVRGYRPAWLGKIDVRRHAEFLGRLDPNPAYFVLPDAPKKALTAPSRGGMLNAAEALAKAKAAPQTSVDMQSVASALEKKYPGKKMRVQGDMCGYDEPWFNPETKETEMVFMPIMHTSLLKELAGSR
jgi:type IV secretion system protein VirD4